MTDIIVCVFICIVAAVLLLHYRNVRRITTEHNNEMTYMNNEYEKNRSQMVKRESGLNGYDFLKYNLQQSLIVQPGISINV
ncbi:hypothetical protein J1N09_09215 [Aureitalea sp. L0-47]|uniref:hypothetical protein n=1 Tax=Aureitalea sp. L0-47 TaxID=2816962 RepID=UPI002237CCC9|nr:hypothetical protein [Aureitalea sp. L0-47]MCW5520016.1 hypothetical protein [Aureitalea sp. L0-47]